MIHCIADTLQHLILPLSIRNSHTITTRSPQNLDTPMSLRLQVKGGAGVVAP